MPTVSIVVPNYNHARFLPKRLESILHQSYEDFEVILLDDCSNDDSQSILSCCARDARVRLDFNRVNSGSTFKQWNKGVRMAQGKYVWIAESDDYADTHLLERLVTLLDSDESVAFAYCRSWRVTADGRIDGFADWHLDTLDAGLWRSDFCADGPEQCRKYFLRSPVVSNASAAVFRKTTYQVVGGADESLRLCADWKLWTAMALTGRVAYVNQPLNYFRDHHQTVRASTGRQGIDVQEKLRVMRWILERTTPTASELRIARSDASKFWVPAVMSLRTSTMLRRAILREVRALDPHPIRRSIGPAFATIQRALARRWRELSSGTRQARTTGGPS